MTRTMQNRNSGRTRPLQYAMAAFAGLTIATSVAAAQEAIGVPFVGRNHLSFTVTDLSRDGINTQRVAVFGGIYGRKLGRDEAAVQYTVIVRAAARALENSEDGVVDAGVAIAATHRPAALNALSLTAAAGASAVVWGDEQADINGERGRVIGQLPLNAGAAYDLHIGGATLAPFATLTGAYSREYDYVNGERVGASRGWRLGYASGVSLRFRETVFSISGVNRERGMPNRQRTVFSAGMSW